MSELLDKILAAKAQQRKELAKLPFDKKLDLMEKIRDRSRMLAESPLLNQAKTTNPMVTVSGIGVALPAADARKKALTPPVAHQLQDQLNTHQNLETVIAALSTRNGRWQLTPLVGSEPESGSQEPA